MFKMVVWPSIKGIFLIVKWYSLIYKWESRNKKNEAQVF